MNQLLDYKNLWSRFYMASSNLRDIAQRYIGAYTPDQKDWQMKEFLRATPDSIDDLAQTTDMWVYAFNEKFNEIDARLDSMEAALGSKAKAETKQNPPVIVPEIEISKQSIKQARKEIIKELQKEFSR